MRGTELSLALLLCACSADTPVPEEAGVDEGSSVSCPLDFEHVEIAVIDESAGVHASAAIDAMGRMWIAYADTTDGAVHVAHRVDDGWHAEPILSGTARTRHEWIGRAISLAVATGDEILVAYFDSRDNNLKLATNRGGSWTVDVVDSKPLAGIDVSLAVGVDGLLHLAYLDLADGDLRYAHGQPGDWTIEVLDSEEYVGNDPGIVVTDGGAVHISYYYCGSLSSSCREGQLRHAGLEAGGDFSVETVDPSDDSGWYTWLAVDSDGNPHISYYCHGAEQLRYATRADDGWRTEIVDEGPGTGEFTSLVLLGGHPFIAYHGGVDESLWIAEQRSDGMWQTHQIDSGNVGDFAALVVTGRCSLACAYYDAGEGVLKIAEVR